MGDLVNLSQYRENRGAPKPVVTWDTIRDEHVQNLFAEWEKLARHNRLNDYFKRQFSSHVEYGTTTNYMSDLNAISILELKLDMFPIIWFPGMLNKTQHGWIVEFRFGDEKVFTPELANEPYARCFALLLFIKVKGAALAAGLLK